MEYPHEQGAVASVCPSDAMAQMQGGDSATGVDRATFRLEQEQSGTLQNTQASGAASGCTPMDVILDFKILDQNKDGEITAVEFIDGLRSNRQLASKFGLSDDILDEIGTRTKYELIFGSIDYNHSETVNVI
jgi:hypothetical protein